MSVQFSNIPKSSKIALKVEVVTYLNCLRNLNMHTNN